MSGLTKDQLRQNNRSLLDTVSKVKAALAAEREVSAELRMENQSLRNAAPKTIEVERVVERVVVSPPPPAEIKERVVRKGRIEDATELARLKAENSRLKRELDAK